MRLRVCFVVLLSNLVGTAAVAERPVPVSPGGAGRLAVVSDRCPTFNWTAVDGAGAVDLVVYRVPQQSGEGPPELVLSINLPDSAHGWTPSLAQCLEPGGRYAWSVGASGEWSEASLFEVSAVPSVVEVHEAMAVLMRFLGEAESLRKPGETSAPVNRTNGVREFPQSAEVDPGARRLGHGPPGDTPDADDEAGSYVEQGHSPAAPLPSSSPALVIDDQIHLGVSSDVFRDGEVFLWTDGKAFSAIGSLSLGHRALEMTTGTNNTGVGHTALRLNTTGTNNSGFGEDALYANSTGANNSAFGEDALLLNTTGSDNSAFGEDALRTATEASENSAFGADALRSATGSGNSAFGAEALNSNTTASNNSAFGLEALEYNTSGSRNSAFGYRALWQNTTNSRNSAFGQEALSRNNGGSFNSAFGETALFKNTTGDRNSAFGQEALYSNTTGSDNSAFGQNALTLTTTGSHNIAFGESAHSSNETGSYNTALGENALAGTSGGSNNIAVGYRAGSTIGPSGSYNILIGSKGVVGDDNTIRIGTSDDHDRAFIAGIRGVTTGQGDAISVLIDSEGQLGTASSSRAVKQDIHEIGERSRQLLALRPVAFRYRKHVEADPNTPRQYGLIAEEVAKEFPELVVFDEEEKPFTVKYHLLSSLLLNELQKQHRQNQVQWTLMGLMFLGTVALTVGRWRFG